MQLSLIAKLPEKIKTSLDDQLQDIRQEYEYIYWTDPKYYYLTLHPLGHVGEPQKFINQIEESIFDISKTHLYSHEIKIFVKNNITLYLNFTRNKNLERLIDRLKERSLISDQREFMPHITLAKYKLPSKQQYLLLKKKLENLNVMIEFPVSKIYLAEVSSNKEKPTYKKIAEFSLF